ncbi:hypothetical protein ADK36_17145, partial [Streptomyces viridochromogenes]
PARPAIEDEAAQADSRGLGAAAPSEGDTGAGRLRPTLMLYGRIRQATAQHRSRHSSPSGD